jgi:hypothetical protein
MRAQDFALDSIKFEPKNDCSVPGCGRGGPGSEFLFSERCCDQQSPGKKEGIPPFAGNTRMHDLGNVLIVSKSKAGFVRRSQACSQECDWLIVTSVPLTDGGPRGLSTLLFCNLPCQSEWRT